MPHMTDYHCRNCGHDFTIEILSRDEAEKVRDKGQYVGPVLCPKCSRADLESRRSAA